MDIILNRSSLELREKISFVGNSAIVAAWADKMDVILPSKCKFIVSRMVSYKGLRLEKEMGFSSFHKMIYYTDIVSNQISLVFERFNNRKAKKKKKKK